VEVIEQILSEGASLARTLKSNSTEIFMARLFWPGFFLILWEILLRAENPGLMSDDSGEMIAGSWTLGLPHPPGYPFFDLLGRLFSFVPIGSIAFRYNLLSALFCLGAVLLTAKTALLLARQGSGVWRPAWMAPGSALAAGSLLLFNRGLFSQALSAKGVVYTLTLFLVSFLAWWRVSRADKGFIESKGYFLLFIWAVGLTNHWQTVLLFIPFLGFWFWTSKWMFSFKKASWALTGILIGLSPYLYLPLRVRQGPFPCWGNPVTLKEFYWVVSRQFVKGGEPYFHPVSFYLGSIHVILKGWVFDWCPGFGILACLGIFFILREKLGWGRLFLILYVTILIGVFGVHEEKNNYLLNVYLVSMSGLWTLFGFWGFWSLARRISKRNSRLLGGPVFIFMVIGIGFWAFSVFRLENKSFYTLAGDFGENALKLTPRNAVLVAGGDHYVMPIFYDQFVLGLRPDVLFTPDIFLTHDWGWSQIARKRPMWNAGWRSEKTLAGRWAWLLREGDEAGGVYYSFGTRYLEPVLNQARGEWIPDGLVTRWAPQGEGAGFFPGKLDWELGLERKRGLASYWNFEGRDYSSTEIFHYYGDQFFKTADWFREKGQGAGELPWLDRGLSLYPLDSAACNNLAALVAQAGNWELAIVILKDAVKLSPDSIPGRFNLTALYEKEDYRQQAETSYKILSSLMGSPDETLKAINLKLSLSNQPKTHRVPRPSTYYDQLAKSYNARGLAYLAQKALETSQILSQDPSGMSL
jgi:tetratricopeptide (TPR) repeat protein